MIKFDGLFDDLFKNDAIYNIAYSLYKIDWLNVHKVTRQEELEKKQQYFQYILENDCDVNEYSFDDFIQEEGYSGECYVSLAEFSTNEFLDKEYILELLGQESKAIKELYLQELQKIE